MKRIKHLHGNRELSGNELNRGDQFLEPDHLYYFFSLQSAPFVKTKTLNDKDLGLEGFCMDYYERVELLSNISYVRLNKHQKKHVINGRKYLFKEKDYERWFDKDDSWEVDECLIFEE